MKQKLFIIAAVIVAAFLFLGKARAQDAAVIVSNKPTKDEIISYVLNRVQSLNSPFKASIILAIIEQESSFDSEARGSIGEYGLMQLTSGAVSDVKQFTNIGGVEGYASDWRANITAGIAYLQRLNASLKDINASIRAYNAWDGTTSAFVAGTKGSPYLNAIKSKAEIYKQYD